MKEPRRYAPERYDTRRGERNTSSKLTEERVRQIREARARGEKLKDIAAAFGIAASTVHHICKGTAWRHSYETAS